MTDVVDQARKCLQLSLDANGENIKRAKDDIKFSIGNQWPEDVRTARELETRPCLTINKTDTFCRQVINNIRQQRPSIKVHAVDNGADPKIAKVLQGLIKHIEVNSSADAAYDTATEHAVRGGWGYIRVDTDYIREDSFDQDIYIRRVRNPFTVYLDPMSVCPDGSDAEWAIVTDMMRRDEFKRTYPKAQFADFQLLDDSPDWQTEDQIRIAEYFRVERVRDTLCRLSDGSSKFKSALPDPQTMVAAGLQIVDERPTFRRVVRWYKVTGYEVLESQDWAGRYIPVIPVYGAEFDIDGKVTRHGMVRPMRDPQIMYNYWATAETEVVALAPKAPWLVAEGQLEGQEETWELANTKSYAYLQYKPITADGVAVPPPIRTPPASVPAGVVNARMGAADDLKAVAGLFDPSLGAQGNETSGKMVERRQQQGDMSNFHFYDNLTRSLRHLGRVLLDLIPVVYDTQRVVRIIGDDGKPETVTLNERQDAEGIARVLNDVTVGTYDVVMDTGPGYATRRQEAAAMMIDSLKALPQVGQVAADLIFRNMDWPGAEQVADRLAAANPMAQIDEQSDVPPRAQMQLKQAQHVIQQLLQKVDALETDLKHGLTKSLHQDATKMAIAHMGDATKREDTHVRASTQRDVAEIHGATSLLNTHTEAKYNERAAKQLIDAGLREEREPAGSDA